MFCVNKNLEICWTFCWTSAAKIILKMKKWYEKRHFLTKMPFFMARHRGFEPLAFGSVDQRSIQLG